MCEIASNFKIYEIISKRWKIKHKELSFYGELCGSFTMEVFI